MSVMSMSYSFTTNYRKNKHEAMGACDVGSCLYFVFTLCMVTSRYAMLQWINIKTEINQCNLADCLHLSCLPTTSHLGCGITRLLLCSATLSVWLYCTGEASHETLRKILEVYNQHLCSSLFQLHHASQLAWQDRLCCRVQLHPQRILQCLCPQQSGHFRKVSPVRCTITCTVYYSAN